LDREGNYRSVDHQSFRESSTVPREDGEVFVVAKSNADIRREERYIKALERIATSMEKRLHNEKTKQASNDDFVSGHDSFFQIEMRGTVSDAGGGEIILTLDRNTHVYPPIGKEVVVLYQMRQQERVYQLKQQG
jgi:hypothetical protein